MKNTLWFLTTSSLMVCSACLGSDPVDSESDDSIVEAQSYARYALDTVPPHLLFSAFITPVRNEYHLSDPHKCISLTFCGNRDHEDVMGTQRAFVDTVQFAVRQHIDTSKWYEVNCITYPVDTDIIAAIVPLGLRATREIGGIGGIRTIWSAVVLPGELGITLPS